jgi:hypothetical protein
MNKFYQYPMSERGLVDVPANRKRAWHRMVRKMRSDAYRVVKVAGGVRAFDTEEDYRTWRNQK